MTGLVNQELLLRNECLSAENRILRAQLPSRLRLSDAERSTPAEIAKRAYGGQLTARLTPQFTVSISARVQHNQLNGHTSPAMTLSLNMKSPN